LLKYTHLKQYLSQNHHFLVHLQLYYININVKTDVRFKQLSQIKQVVYTSSKQHIKIYSFQILKIFKPILLLSLFVFQANYTFAQLRAEAGNNVKVCLNAQLPIGGSPTAIYGEPDYSYSWSPAAGLSCSDCANPMASPSENTTYVVTVTDKEGNTAMDSVLVELTTKLKIVTPTDTLCREAACLELLATVQGGVWEGNGVTGNMFCPTDATGGTKTITYTVENHPTCSGSDSIKIPQKRKPRLDISISNDTICFGKEIIINNNSPEKESYQYFMNDFRLNLGFNNNNFNINLTDEISRTGTYTIVQKLINHPCPATDTLVLKIKRQSNFGFDLNRTGPCGRSYYIKNTSVDKSLIYNWDFGNGFTEAVFQPDTMYFNPAVSGKDTFYFVTISIEDPICDDTEINSTLYVGYRPIPIISAQRLSTDTLCNLIDTLAFNSNLDFDDIWLDSVQWKLGTYGQFNGSNNVGSQINLSPVLFDKRNLNDATTDTVTLITYGRCGSDSATYIVNLDYTSSAVQAAFETDKPIYCIGDTVHFNNTSDVVPNYFWDFGNGLTAMDKNTSHIYNEAGEYAIQLTAAEACGATTASHSITVIPYPNNASLSYLPLEPLTQQTITLLANAEGQDVFSYQWNFGDYGESTEQTPTLYFERAGNYPVELLISSVEANCPILLTTNITVDQNIIIYEFFPTAFSPNADGINDCYEVELPYYVNLELLQIYDRWGTLIFETNTTDICWNGKHNNKALSIGVYVYQAVLRDIKDEVYHLRGNITLVR